MYLDNFEVNKDFLNRPHKTLILKEMVINWNTLKLKLLLIQSHHQYRKKINDKIGENTRVGKSRFIVVKT